jgi:MurNAc alpha-1-phosphate uridylyltransferase
MIKQAFILGAGLGTRMRHLTKDIAKPMIEVAGQSLITRLIDQLIEYGVTRIVINVFYKPDLLMEHVKKHMSKYQAIEYFFSEELDLLETGGGIIRALEYLEDKPFFVVNGDSVFIGEENAFSILNKHWEDRMNAIFLLTSLDRAIGYDGKGDFVLDKDKQLAQSQNLSYVYIGAHITKPEIFASYKIQKIKLMDIYKKFLSKNIFQNIYGIIYQGHWLHVGTPEGLEQANEFIESYSNKDSAAY